MFLHIGEGKLIKKRNVVGIFDLESTTISKNTRIYLNKAEKNGEVENVSYDLPKSFTVCSKEKGKQKVYISQISSATLNKRSGFIDTL